MYWNNQKVKIAVEKISLNLVESSKCRKDYLEVCLKMGQYYSIPEIHLFQNLRPLAMC